jgi:mRNA-degrading endonuclease toxin of MazEF toxin-antitoxin module
MHVKISGCRLKNKGTIKTEQIRVIDKQRISKKIGKVSKETINQIGLALQHTLDYY